VRFTAKVENITEKSTGKYDVLVTATLTISDFWKREVDGLYLPRRRFKAVQFGFDKNWPTEARIGYAELI